MVGFVVLGLDPRGAADETDPHPLGALHLTQGPALRQEVLSVPNGSLVSSNLGDFLPYLPGLNFV